LEEAFRDKAPVDRDVWRLRSPAQLRGRLAQHIEQMGAIKQRIALENLGDRYLAATRRLVGRWHGFRTR
jgi:hypothetical protein